MTSLPTVLIFTYPERGQANVNLATSYELALAGVNVFIASFASLESRISRIQDLVARHRHTKCSDSGPTGSVSFCECKGITPYMDAVSRAGLVPTAFKHPRGVSGALKNLSALDILAFPWSPEEHLVAIKSAKEVIAAVKPNVVVVDTLFQAATDACQLMGKKFIAIFPNTVKDVAVTLQPYLAALWKYPILSSGFSYLLKWWEIPLNIYLYIRLGLRMATSQRANQILALRRSLGIKSIFLTQVYPEVPLICPGLPETDFPLTVIPEEMVLCGPIIVPFDPLEESDPVLSKWLDNGSTVIVNLGSQVVCDEALAREMAGAFRVLLDHHDRKGTRRMQVLWKAKANEDVRKTIDEIVGKEMEEGRVKVVTWLDVEPVAVLQHPNVVCTVHHGGANSFYEGVWSGLPHVVLPVWTDTYDNATRAEFLNIGVFGSKSSAPDVQAEEFGEALVRVTGNTEEAGRFRLAAKRLREVCRAKGEGRKLSSMTILKEMGITR